MGEITRGLIARVGVDLAKQVIQVHAADSAGRRVVARALKRDQFQACVNMSVLIPSGLSTRRISAKIAAMRC